jgi:hypothetical protein
MKGTDAKDSNDSATSVSEVSQAKSLRANVPMPHGDASIEPVGLEFFRGQVRPDLMVLEGMKMARGPDGLENVVRK